MKAASARVLALLTLVAGLARPLPAQEAVFLVRHAEKVDESEDAALSEAGHARARALASLLGQAGIKAIYATEFQRTQKTAEPLAQALGLSPMVIPSRDSKQLAERIRKEQAGARVMVVGHSNTVPEIIAALGHPEKVTIASDEYDNLFVVVPRGGGAPAFLRLKF